MEASARSFAKANAKPITAPKCEYRDHRDGWKCARPKGHSGVHADAPFSDDLPAAPQSSPLPYALGATSALEVVEQAFVSISSAQGRRNDAGMDLLAQDLKRAHEVLSERDPAFEAMEKALTRCDNAFVSWQVGQIPGRPEDILALVSEVRAALKLAQEAR